MSRKRPTLEEYFYSAQQDAALERAGRQVGVIMDFAHDRLTLWTGTRNAIDKAEGDAQPYKAKRDPALRLYRAFPDAVTIGNNRSSDTLIVVDGLGELTKQGRAFCERMHLPESVEKLRRMAVLPSAP